MRHHLAAMGLPTGLETLGARAWSIDALLDHMTRDKKVEAGKITFVLARGIGRAFLTQEVDASEVGALLSNAAAA